MKFKREKKVYPTIHWAWRGYAFCGQSGKGVHITPDKNKVSCQRCRKQMELHDHLKKEE